MITNKTYQEISPGCILISWASDEESPTFTVWKNGELFLTTTAYSCLITLAAGETASIDIFDDDSVPGVSFTGRMLLEWDVDPLAASYRVDRYIDSAWQTLQSVPIGSETHVKWESPFLADCTAHTFRIVPIDAYGNEGRARDVVAYMVRPPDAPDAAYAYDAETGLVTITCS